MRRSTCRSEFVFPSSLLACTCRFVFIVLLGSIIPWCCLLRLGASDLFVISCSAMLISQTIPYARPVTMSYDEKQRAIKEAKNYEKLII